jgi:hypothetical protein
MGGSEAQGYLRARTGTLVATETDLTLRQHSLPELMRPLLHAQAVIDLVERLTQDRAAPVVRVAKKAA